MTDLPTTNPPWGAQPPARLPVLDTVRQAYAALWEQRDDLLRVAAVPALAAFGLNLILDWRFGPGMHGDPLNPPQLGAGAFLLMLLAWLPMTLFSVNWKRVLLLGRDSVSGLGLRWRLRETLYLIRAIVLLLAATLAGVIASLPLILLLAVLGVAAGFIGGAAGPGVGIDQASYGMGFLIGVIGAIPVIVVEFYVMFRLMLALPATAIDRSRAFRLSWERTRGTVGRLFLAYLLVVLPPYVAIFLFQLALNAAGLFDVAPFSGQLIGTLLGFVAAAAGSSVLAMAYRRLVGAASAGA